MNKKREKKKKDDKKKNRSEHLDIEKKTVTRNIYYYYSDGNKVIDVNGEHAVAKQWADFSRKVHTDPMSGSVKYDEWEKVTFGEIPVMEVKGFSPDISVVPAVQNVTPDNPPEDIKVYYSRVEYDAIVNIDTISSMDMSVGGKRKLISKDSKRWSSSAQEIVSVDGAGIVTAVGPGRAEIFNVDTGTKKSIDIRVLFNDVNTGNPFFDAVYWAVDMGIAKGNEGVFMPFAQTTREQVVVFLWRMEGTPLPQNGETPFKDVTDKKSYSYNAIMWAAQQGITKVANERFAPKSACRRRELITFLWRLAGSPKSESQKQYFTDVEKNASDSYMAINWAAENNIARGKDGKFSPDSFCVRGEAMNYIYRFKCTS